MENTLRLLNVIDDLVVDSIYNQKKPKPEIDKQTATTHMRAKTMFAVPSLTDLAVYPGYVAMSPDVHHGYLKDLGLDYLSMYGIQLIGTRMLYISDYVLKKFWEDPSLQTDRHAEARYDASVDFSGMTPAGCLPRPLSASWERLLACCDRAVSTPELFDSVSTDWDLLSTGSCFLNTDPPMHVFPLISTNGLKIYRQRPKFVCWDIFKTICVKV